jgi:hypothetical protein
MVQTGDNLHKTIDTTDTTGEFVTPGAENKATLRTPERKAVSANSKVQHFSSPTESTT